MMFDLTETQLNIIFAGLMAAEAYAKKANAEQFLEDILDARQTLLNQEEI